MCLKKAKVESFETFNLRISAMRHAHLFEAVCEGPEVYITVYNPYASKDDERYLVCKTKRDTGSFIDLLNECELMRWDGFQGKHPLGVKDGTMFSMDAVVNGGRRISADGSENFPKGYKMLEKALYDILRESEGSD